MKTNDRNSLIVFPILLLIGYLVALAGSQGGATLGGVPIFAIAVGLAFLIQWLAFIPAYIFQTEKFFDLTGSITYISVIGVAFCYSRYSVPMDARSVLVAALVIIWAIRLGTFLFSRIRKAGKDDRFDEIKPNFLSFLNVWTIQGLWVTFTAAAVLVAITSATRKDLDAFAIVGALVWVIGFAFEVIADSQKSCFNADPNNKGKFIQTGLWSRSRHPNYFGEIVLDAKGLVALWREGLLAQAVLSGQTHGYKNHPQLERFKAQPDPQAAINAYLLDVYREAEQRSYRFDIRKLEVTRPSPKIRVTEGQMRYEWARLQNKLLRRDPPRHKRNTSATDVQPHPLMEVIPGEIESWERLSS